MSSCLSGAGRTLGFDLDIVKSPSPSTYSHSSSPSSTLSESSNSPLTISTRKPRTPRKRPNQTYTEAAALLSAIYPNIFSTKNLRKPCKHLKSYDSFSESSELLPSFPAIDNTCFLLHQRIPEKPVSRIEPKTSNSSEKACKGSADVDFQLNSPSSCNTFEEDFDVESILDEEMEGGVVGIDSIMGNLNVSKDTYDGPSDFRNAYINACYRNPMGLGFGFGRKVGFEFGGRVRALKQVGEGDWWRSPTVEILDIIPKSKPPSEKKKKKKKVERREEEDQLELRLSKENLQSGLSLKLNYEEVLNAWSDRGSPFSNEFPISDSTESSPDAIARLLQFDLISGIGNGGVREASVLRYKEKRRTRLFSKKIRYQVRKVNADRRPRMKGRFVRRPSLLH
ncbi:hypothetical protein AAC387_Pa07g0371 [Persea americana]